MFEYGDLQETEYLTPQVRLLVRSPTRPDRSFVVDAVVDTGASITCLPSEPIMRLELEEYGFVHVLSALGEAEARTTTYVSLEFGTFQLQDREILIYDQPYALLGRDVLNSYRITLDAPQSMWSME